MSGSGELLDEICERITRHAGADSRTQIDGFVVSRHESSAPDYELAEPLFVLMAQGGKRLYFDRRVIDYRAGDCLAVTASMPLSGHFIDASPEHPALAIGMRLGAAQIAALRPQLHEEAEGRAPSKSSIAVHPADDQLLDAVLRLLRLLDEPVDAVVLAPLIEREILWRLLRGPLGSSIAQIGLADSVLSHIGDAISQIRENLSEPVAIRELARVAGMSVSTFHRHFHRLTGLSPLQFQKRLQLQAARSLLLAEASVTAVAHAVGYGSPTQFNREYRRQFGMPPARDIAELRSRAAT